MSIKIAVARFTNINTATTQDITTTDLDGLTPKAAIFISSDTVTDGTVVSVAMLNVGLTDGTNHCDTTMTLRHNVATMETAQRAATDQVIQLLGSGAGTAIFAEAQFSTWLTNGVRINWNDPTSNTYIHTVIFFAGTDLSVKVGTFEAAGPNGTETTVTTTFQPDDVFFISGGTAFDDTMRSGAQVQLGVAHRGGSITQGSISHNHANGTANAEPEGLIQDDRIGANLATGLSREFELSAFLSNGFKVKHYESASSASQWFGYLALNYGGKANGYVGTDTTPTSTGDKVNSSVGFEPQFVMLLPTFMPALNTLYNNGNVASYGISAITSTQQHSQTVGDDDNSLNSDTQSLLDDTALHMWNPNGDTDELVASRTSLNSNGFTLNYSTVNATARQMIVWAISVFSSGTTYNQTVSGSITPTGALVKQGKKILTGGITPTGVAVKQDKKILTGALAPAGVLTKQAKKLLTGGITPSGALNRLKLLFKALTGSITPTGSLRKQTNKVLTGSLTPVGVLLKTATKRLGGSITPTAVLATAKVIIKALSGSLTPTGSLRNQTVKRLTGSLTPSGTLVKLTKKVLTGTVGLAGLVTRLRGEARAILARYRGIFSSDKLSFTVQSAPWSVMAYGKEITQDITSYDHSHLALGGFWNANVTIRVPFMEIGEWIERGVGLELRVRGKARTTVFEGIVNRVSMDVGGYNVSIGPYMDICNKIKITYSVLVQLGDGTATGLRAETDYLSDTVSQGKYGILTKNFSAGGISEDYVAELQNMLLLRYANPAKSEDLNIPGDVGEKMVDVKLECLGYIHLLQKYFYNSETTGAQDLSSKLEDIIDAEPNSSFAHNIAENTLQVGAFENDDNEAWGLVKGLLALGDVNYERYNFGCYADRTIHYKAVDETIVYYRSLREGSGFLHDRLGGTVNPWDVKPGIYLMVTDMLPGKPVTSDINSDPRVIFAESVQFRMPDNLIINGSHIFKIEQRLAQLGIKGIG